MDTQPRRLTRRTTFEAVTEKVGFAGFAVGLALCFALGVLLEIGGDGLLEFPLPAWVKATLGTALLVGVGTLALVIGRYEAKHKRLP
jgi:hypothetical protein